MARLLKLRSSVIFWILSAYVLVLTGHFIYRAFNTREIDRESRGFLLQHALRVTKPLLRDNRARELGSYLREAVSSGLIDHYELELRGRATDRQGKGPARRPVLSEPLSVVDGWVWGRAETADGALYMASGVGWQARVAKAWSEEWARLPADFVFLALTCLLSLLFQSTGGRARAAQAPAEARESKRSRLRRQEKARDEIEHSEFEGVFGRAFFGKQAELVGKLEGGAFFAAVEELYADCAMVLARYDGKMHSVHGNELLFFFAEGDGPTQARMALAAARDMERLASKRGFSLASALSYGPLRGAHLQSGFALFGPPLEQTAELIQCLLAQKRHAIWVAEPMVRLAQPHARFDAQVIDGRKNLGYALAGQGELRKIIDHCKEGRVSELAFHRSDDAVAAVLRALCDDTDWSRESFVATVGELRQVECRRFGAEVTETYRSLLSAEMLRKDSYRLSSVLALAPHLLSRRTVDRPFEKLFLQAAALKDKRVRANAIDIFTRLFPEREVPELRPHIKDEDGRVSANAMVKAACERFDEKLIARLEERLREGTVGHVAAALYAMGEIAHYYRRHDPALLATKTSFMRIFDHIATWVQHPNPMIQRQALLAAHKLQNQAVDARIQQLFSSCEDPELLKLFAATYGWRKERRSHIEPAKAA